MKIGLIVPGFSSHEEEWAIPALQNIVRELAGSHRVTVFTLRYPHQRSRYRISGAEVVPLGGAAATGFKRFPLLIRGLSAILSEHRREAFDVLHGFWVDEPGFLAAIAGRLSGVPSVASVMGGELVNFPAQDYGGQRSNANRLLCRQALRLADRITCGSRLMLPLIEMQVRALVPRLLPLGVDVSAFLPDDNFSRKGRNKDRFQLLNVASLNPIKGHAVLIEALAIAALKNPRIRLKLVGTGPLQHELALLVQKCGLSDRVDFVGAVPHGQMRSEYLTGELFVQASFYESQGMAVLEAAACGLPAVGTAVGILPELVGASTAVPAGDPAALANSILEIAGDPAQRERLARTGVEAVAREFTLCRYLERLLEIYGELRP